MTRVALALTACLAVLLSCSRHGASGPIAKAPAGAASSPATMPVTFLENSFDTAVTKARAEKKWLFVDAWAPWCHSCKSMRAFVLNDPKLGALNDAYVWLEVDTENDANRAFVSRFANKAWPTLRVLDPATLQVVLEWEGTATADELVALLDDVRNTSTRPTLEILKRFLEATHKRSERNFDEAAALFEQVLAEAPKEWPHRARAMEAWMLNASDRKDFAGCADRASTFLEDVSEGTTSYASILATGLSSSAEAKGRNAQSLVARAERFLERDDARILADDRSSVFESLVHHYKDRGLGEDATRVARTWFAFVTNEARKASSPETRSVFDAHTVEAAILSGTPERAIPALEASERDFPKDYNPPARLARVYLEIKRFDDARFAIARATSRVYGPRALRVLILAADIAKARADRTEEREALDEALRRTENLTLTPSQVKARAAAEERRNALPARK